MIGDSKEERTDPAGLTLGVSATEAERAVRMFPLLANVNVVRTWGAIRVMTQDGFPIYDESESHPGAFTVVLPFGRDAGGQPCAHYRADDRARCPRQVAGRSLQCAEVPCSRGWLTPVRPSPSRSTASPCRRARGDTVAAALLAAGIDALPHHAGDGRAARALLPDGRLLRLPGDDRRRRQPPGLPGAGARGHDGRDAASGERARLGAMSATRAPNARPA